MKREHISVKKIWKDYLSSISEYIDNTNKKYQSWYFSDDEKSAKSLANLVINEVKRATASSYISYEIENEPIPKEGDLSIITDYNGIAQCIIKTTNIDIVPYKDVTSEFAEREGEGDKSLSYWKNVHKDFFSRELREYGKKFDEDMLVICEDFELVYK